MISNNEMITHCLEEGAFTRTLHLTGSSEQHIQDNKSLFKSLQVLNQWMAFQNQIHHHLPN